MNKYFYPAIFSKEKEYYNVKFIDFDDIFTFGMGFDIAYYMAKDALFLRAFYVEMNFLYLQDI